jgi:hypothetical protein
LAISGRSVIAARTQNAHNRHPINLAGAASGNASPAVERPARLLTWVADEHLLYVIAAGLWLASRAGDERQRRQTDHLVLSVVATAILPHLLKRLVDQERPDDAWSMGAVAVFHARATPTTPFLLAMPCMWAQSRPPSHGHFHGQRRSPGDLAA